MKTTLRSVSDPGSDATLSIGDLARRTGVTAATLRVWETRYGFPVPQRRDSGHRRYVEADVARILDVVRRREAGTRLDVAIEQSAEVEAGAGTSDGRSAAEQSVFAQLRRTFPTLMPHRLHKKTLLRLSWAIEDEVVARGERAHVFGAFQKEQHYESARDRWAEIARGSSSAYVFADFEHDTETSPRKISLAPDAAMRREWAVVCDSPGLPVALSAWELPGQQSKQDSERMFEAIWTLEPEAVREVACTCATLASESETVDVTATLRALDGPPSRSEVDLAGATALFNRILAYVDTPPPR